MVSDGKWHTMELVTDKQNFTMRIDHGTSRTILNDGPNEHLKVSTPLFIGGIPKDVGSAAIKQWHIRETNSFNGKDKSIIYYYQL